MSEPMTSVEITFLPDYLNNWLRFGVPDEHQILDRRRSLLLFKPDRLFGYVRWQASEYGTRKWRFTIVRTHKPSDFLCRVEGVNPGGEILLMVSGKSRVQRALLLIDTLERSGFDPACISPAYYRNVHNRITVGRPVRTYSADQHAAHLASKRANE